jgi:hypothetical protein
MIQAIVPELIHNPQHLPALVKGFRLNLGGQALFLTRHG